MRSTLQSTPPPTRPMPKMRTTLHGQTTSALSPVSTFSVYLIASSALTADIDMISSNKTNKILIPVGLAAVAAGAAYGIYKTQKATKEVNSEEAVSNENFVDNVSQEKKQLSAVV